MQFETLDQLVIVATYGSAAHGGTLLPEFIIGQGYFDGVRALESEDTVGFGWWRDPTDERNALYVMIGDLEWYFVYLRAFHEKMNEEFNFVILFSDAQSAVNFAKFLVNVAAEMPNGDIFINERSVEMPKYRPPLVVSAFSVTNL